MAANKEQFGNAVAQAFALHTSRLLSEYRPLKSKHPTMKALVLTPKDRKVAVRELPTPVPGPNEVLIKVVAVALNPVDSLYVANPIATQDQRVVGTDFAGVVVGSGDNLSSSNDERAQIGARVAGFLQGACSVNDRPGAFAEFITIEYDLVWSVPLTLSLEAASTISMCGLTAAQGVFDRLELPSPFHQKNSFQDLKNLSANDPIQVFIYGATTSLGLYAAQHVRLAERTSGRKIHLIGAASASKHQFLRAAPYSYDALVDYRDPDWPERVRKAAQGRGVHYAVDCISEGSTVENVHHTLSEDGKGLAVFRGPAGGKYSVEKLRVKPIYGAVWEGLGVEIGYNGFTLPALPEARAFATNFYKYLGSEAATGRVNLEPNPVRLMPGGLDKIVPDGFTLLGSATVSGRAGGKRQEDFMRPISGEKLVYKISDI